MLEREAGPLQQRVPFRTEPDPDWTEQTDFPGGSEGAALRSRKDQFVRISIEGSRKSGF